MKQQNQNLIVINGRTYDARSGMMIDKKETPAPSGVTLRKVFSDVGPVKNKAQSNTPSPAKASATPELSKATAARRHVAAKNIHQAPQKTHTLLRHGLVRPQLDIAPRPRPRVNERNSQQAAREERATTTDRHQNVQRFSPQTPTILTQQKETTAQPEAPSVSMAQLQNTHMPAQPKQAPQAQGSELKEQLIKARLEEADQPKDGKLGEHQEKVDSFFSKQPRLLSALAGALGVLVLVGYVTYLNLPGISMRIAANRAGFAATMPVNKPTGYGLNGPVAYEPGQISLNYTSNTNNDKFTLTQKESGWDSQALLDNYVAKHTDNYLTYQEKGLTIYMYDGKASWVNGGVWYNIDGSAKLSSDQILKMATSM